MAEANINLSGIVARLIERVPLFKGLTQAELLQFLSSSSQLSFRKDETIFGEGEHSQSMYVILRGSVELLRKASIDNPSDPIGVLGAGDCFGEMALADALPRSAAAVARSDATLVAFSEGQLANTDRMDRIVFENLATVLAARFSALEERIAPYLQPNCMKHCLPMMVDNAMYSVPSLDARQMVVLNQVGRLQTLPAGQAAIRKGTTGQSLYLVVDGELVLSRSDNAEEEYECRLGPGQCCGEIGFLIKEVRRSYGVVASKESRVLRIDSVEFEKLPKLATVLYRYLAKALSIRLRGLNHLYAQIMLSGCQRHCLFDAKPTVSAKLA